MKRTGYFYSQGIEPKLMIRHTEISNKELVRLIKQKEIIFGGNHKLKIYGKLNCRSGKRMKKENRVFFSSEQEAWTQGFRPCGHCMNKEYKKYRQAQNFHSGIKEQNKPSQ